MKCMWMWQMYSLEITPWNCDLKAWNKKAYLLFLQNPSLSSACQCAFHPFLLWALPLGGVWMGLEISNGLNVVIVPTQMSATHQRGCVQTRCLPTCICIPVSLARRHRFSLKFSELSKQPINQTVTRPVWDQDHIRTESSPGSAVSWVQKMGAKDEGHDRFVKEICGGDCCDS